MPLNDRMATPTLSLRYCDNVLSMGFNDFSRLVWDPTQDPSTAKFYAGFCALPGDLPQAYKDVVVMQDTADYTFVWFVGAPDVTIPIPAGALTLGSLMTTMFQCSGQTISTDDYDNITGDTWSGQGQPTMADAVRYGQDGPLQLGNVCLGDSNTIFFRIYQV